MNVELLNHFGDDLMIVNTARVSYDKEAEKFRDKDAKLINYLVKNKHFSPFRHPQLRFRIQCPIFVERQLFKSQVGLSANSVSGRYVDFSDSYSLFQQLRKQSTDSKQGSSGNIEEPLNTELIAEFNELVNRCADFYQKMCENGVAKEQARAILPLCLNTKFIWTGSLLAFLHLFNLRIKPDAQQETREVAEMMLEEIKNIPGEPFKHTLKAFGY